MPEHTRNRPHDLGGLSAAGAGSIAEQRGAPQPQTAHTPSILVIDDDPDLVAVLSFALAAHGYRVLTAVDHQALHLACQERPALILLDLTMPRLDGVAVCRCLRADPRTTHIPILLMSADPRLQRVAATLAVEGLLPKPFLLSDLFAAVERWLGAACRGSN